MHLLRLLPGSLPGRCDRRGPEFRIRHRDARGALLRQGKAAREWRPLGGRDRQAARPRGPLPMTITTAGPANAGAISSAVLASDQWGPAFAGAAVSGGSRR